MAAMRRDEAKKDCDEEANMAVMREESKQLVRKR